MKKQNKTLNQKIPATLQKIKNIEAKDLSLQGEENAGKDIVQFTPSGKMIKWFETAIKIIEEGQNPTVSEIAKQSKLDRNNWAFWQKTPGFIDWWDDQWQAFLKASRYKLDQIGLYMAIVGKNFDWWKEMQIRVGNMPRENNLTQNNFSSFNFHKYVTRKEV